VIDKLLKLKTINSHVFDDMPWYQAVDIANTLGYTNPRKAFYKILSRNQADFEGCTRVEKIRKRSINTTTGISYRAYRATLLINEEGIKKFLNHCHKPIAQKYRAKISKNKQEEENIE